MWELAGMLPTGASGGLAGQWRHALRDGHKWCACSLSVLPKGLSDTICILVPGHFKETKIISVFHNTLTLNFEWPEEPMLRNNLKHIISRLLTFESQHRLGYSGTRQVMEHSWLSHVNWIWMRNRAYEVGTEPKFPFLPRHETREALYMRFDGPSETDNE